MSKTFTVPEAARILGITVSQAYRELRSWPHQGEGTITPTFTLLDLAEIECMMSAGPDEQLARLNLLDAKRAELQALDAA